MISFITDQNFNQHIARGMMRLEPDVDVLALRDLGLAEATDPDVLAAAWEERRVLLTHDFRTMPTHIADRLQHGEHTAGVIIIPFAIQIGAAVQHLLDIARYTLQEDWIDQTEWLPA